MSDSNVPAKLTDKSNLPNQGTPAEQAAGAANTVSPAPTGQLKLEPVPLLGPKRKVDLSTVAMDNMPMASPVESLEVRELKGVGATFTPNLSLALTFKGLVYKPEGEFDATHQILSGQLLRDPRIISRAKTLTFAPVFAWQTCEVAIMPFKMTRFGARVLQTLSSLQPEFPNFKVFVEWNDLKRRHIVQQLAVKPEERELIGKVTWPTKEQMLDALSMTAFDNINDLAAANDEIKTLLTAREVE